MHQVVQEAHLDWLETPDQAVVWGTALGSTGRSRRCSRAARRTPSTA